MICPNCGQSNVETASFCASCGTRLVRSFSKQSDSAIITIGRGQDNTVSVSSTGVSSHHARIIVKNGKVIIEDLNSTNGTYVNGKRIISSMIKAGDRVNLGLAVLDMSMPQIRNLFSLSSEFGVIQNKTSIEDVCNRNELVESPNRLQGQPILVQQVVQQSSQIVYHGNRKSVGLAIVLSFFFGPLGMLYSTITGGIIMFLISVPLAFMTAGLSAFLTAPICVIWAAIAADSENKKTVITTASQMTHSV